MVKKIAMLLVLLGVCSAAICFTSAAIYFTDVFKLRAQGWTGTGSGVSFPLTKSHSTLTQPAAVHSGSDGLKLGERREGELLTPELKNFSSPGQLGMPLPAGHSTNNTQVKKFSQRPIVVGHIHIAKTGGTSINGMAANEFERVCGNKGYSFDFFQSNRRHKAGSKPGTANDTIHKAMGKDLTASAYPAESWMSGGTRTATGSVPRGRRR